MKSSREFKKKNNFKRKGQKSHLAAGLTCLGIYAIAWRASMRDLRAYKSATEGYPQEHSTVRGTMPNTYDIRL